MCYRQTVDRSWQKYAKDELPDLAEASKRETKIKARMLGQRRNPIFLLVTEMVKPL